MVQISATTKFDWAHKRQCHLIIPCIKYCFWYTLQQFLCLVFVSCLLWSQLFICRTIIWISQTIHSSFLLACNLFQRHSWFVRITVRMKDTCLICSIHYWTTIRVRDLEAWLACVIAWLMFLIFLFMYILKDMLLIWVITKANSLSSRFNPWNVQSWLWFLSFLVGEMNSSQALDKWPLPETCWVNVCSREIVPVQSAAHYTRTQISYG